MKQRKFNVYRLFCLYLLFGSALPSMSQDIRTINITDGKTVIGNEETIPTRDVRLVDDGVIVTYTFHYATLTNDPLNKGANFIHIKGFGESDVSGEPCVLSRFDTFTIPIGKGCKVEMVDSSYIELPMKIAPSRPPLVNTGQKAKNTNNVLPIKPYSGLFPLQHIKSDLKKPFKGYTLFDVQVAPIKYDYEHEKVILAKQLKYKVSFVDLGLKETADTDYRLNIDDIDFLNTFTLNGVGESLFSGRNSNDFHYSVENPKLYLILSTPAYASAVNTFAEWKRMMGFTVVTELRNNWDDASITNFINGYDYPASYLTYILIIGSHNDVPAKETTSGMIYHTDYYYTNTLSNSPQIGRLPVSSLNEANIVVNKIINYEKYPILDTNFYNTGLNCAFFQDDNNNGYEDYAFTKTSEDILQYLKGRYYDVNRVYYAFNEVDPQYWSTDYSYGDTIPSYLKRSNGFQWNGNHNDIINKINTGAFYVLHRGHGNQVCWDFPFFSKTHINLLANQSKLPVVFSLNCQTGDFAHTDNNKCFSEAFLTKANGGCVGIFAASHLSIVGYDDILANGFFYSMWPYSQGLTPSFPGMSPNYQPHSFGSNKLGSILNCGRLRLKESGYGSAYYRQYECEIYHCFGDPSMEIRNKMPTPFSGIQITNTANGVEVEVPSGGNISFYNPTTKEVHSYFGFYKNYIGDTCGMILCITKTNKIPYIVSLDDITSPNQTEPITEKELSTQTKANKILSETTKNSSLPVLYKNGNKIILVNKQDECK